MTAANARFGKEDTKGILESQEEYLVFYNAICLDIAREQFKLSESDYLQMIDEHDLT